MRDLWNDFLIQEKLDLWRLYGLLCDLEKLECFYDLENMEFFYDLEKAEILLGFRKA